MLLVVGILGALNAASGYIGAFIRASNVIYEVEEGRPFYKLRPLQLGVTVIIVVAVGLVISALVLSGPLAGSVGDALGAERRGRDRLRRRQVADPGPAGDGHPRAPLLRVAERPGSPACAGSPRAACWRSCSGWRASALFALYVANFGSYNKTYGTLGGAVTFLVWLWITNIAVLLGAELNAELERSREIEAGVPGAEEELQLPPREEAS